MIVALAGGVGGARLLRGLVEVVDPGEVVAVVNTGDDDVLHGLHVSPDIDTVTYTLAGAIDGERGWGLAGDTWAVMDALKRYEPAAPAGSAAGLTWFGLGDRDLATHLYRTQRLAEGAPLSAVTAEIASVWGVAVSIIPMTDDPVATRVELESGEEVSFQDYFVKRRHSEPVAAVSLDGADTARSAPGVAEAIAAAGTVVICPSNPVLSVGPILAVPGVEEAVAGRRQDAVAVSPIVAGAAVRGPADRLLAELGHEPSVVGIARLYAPLVSTLVIDEADGDLAGAVEEEGVRCVVTKTLMHGLPEAAALARTVVDTGRAR